MVTFTGHKVTGSLPSLPAGATGSVYSFTLSAPTAYQTSSAVVTITLSDTDNISLYYSSDEGSNWEKIESAANRDSIQANLPKFPCMIVAGSS